MPGKLDTYNLGDFGVNRTKSPVHIKDGELLSAQNASLNPVGGNRGIGKRKGMAKYSDAAGASILAIAPIYYADPFPVNPGNVDGLTLMYSVDAGLGGTDSLAKSPTGVTWTEGEVSATEQPFAGSDFFRVRGMFYSDGSADYALYFCVDSVSGNLTLRAYNSTSEAQIGDDILAAFAGNALLTFSKDQASQYVWALIQDGAGLTTIKRMDLVSGTVDDWGETFGTGGDYPNEYPNDICEFDGDVYVVTTEIITGNFRTRFRSCSATTSGTLSIDHEIAASASDSLAEWKMSAGGSYLIAGGVTQGATTKGRLLRRTTTGTWTTQRTEALVDPVWIVPMYCVGDEFWVFRNSVGDSTLTLERSVDAGANWSVETTQVDGMKSWSLLEKLGSDFYYAENADLYSDTNVFEVTPGSGSSVVFTRAWSSNLHGAAYFIAV